MSSEPVLLSTAAAHRCCPPLLPTAAACRLPVFAASVLQQLTVSDRQFILLTSVHVSDSVCVCVCTVREVKVNLIRCDIRCVARE